MDLPEPETPLMTKSCMEGVRLSGISAFCQHCATDTRGGWAAELLADPVSGFHQAVQIHTAFDAEAVEQIHHILGRDVAAGAGGVRTATEAGDRAVEGADAELQRGVDIG